MFIIKKRESHFYILLLIGIGLAIYQYIVNRSISHDEAALSINIVTKSSMQLVQPLEYGQVAPILFLQIEKFFSSFINAEYGLRIFPLLCFITSCFLFFRIAKYFFDNKHSLFIAVSLFSLNSIFIYYASEVKQYMSDLLVSLVLTSYVLSVKNCYKRECIILSILGIFCVFMSNISVIILLCVGLLLAYKYFNDPLGYKFYPIIFVFSSWAIGFLIYYTLFVHNHPSRDEMLIYWNKLHGFMPINPFSQEFLKFCDKPHTVLFYIFPSGIVIRICLILSYLIGIFYFLKKKQYEILFLFLFPVLIHLCLSALKLYPYELRLVLYTMPGMILFISAGLYYLLERIMVAIKINYLYNLFYFLPLIQLLVLYKHGYPNLKQNIKDPIILFNKHALAKDKIFVSHQAIPAFKYYEYIGFLQTKATIVYSRFGRYQVNETAKEILNIKGNVWSTFPHDIDREAAYIINKLELSNQKNITKFPNETYLFSLK